MDVTSSDLPPINSSSSSTPPVSDNTRDRIGRDIAIPFNTWGGSWQAVDRRLYFMYVYAYMSHVFNISVTMT